MANNVPLVSTTVEIPSSYVSLIRDLEKSLCGYGSPEVAKRLRFAISAHTKRVGAERFINRTVGVRRNLTVIEAFKETGRVLHIPETAPEIPATISKGVVSLQFFNFGHMTLSSDLDDDLARLGLELDTDLAALAALSVFESDFADTYPYATQLLDDSGSRYSVWFYQFEGERRIHLRQYGRTWPGNVWFPVRPLRIV